MSKKIISVVRHAFLLLFNAAIYGALLYYFYHVALEVSTLLAYVFNIAAIIFALSVDAIIYRFLLSKKLVITDKNYRSARYWYMDSTVSFKSGLYLFYICVLVFSEIIYAEPGLIDADIGKFIESGKYGVLLVTAFDKFIGQVTKDVERTKKISLKFEEYLSNKQEKN